MDKGQHTPGPWAATPQGQIYHQPTMGPGEFVPQVSIGQVYGPSLNPDAKANTHLIAAAPELLAVAEGILDALEHKDRWTSVSRRFAAQSLRAAIAKARGEQS